MEIEEFAGCCKIDIVYDFGGDEDAFRKEDSYDKIYKYLKREVYGRHHNKLFITSCNQDQPNTLEALKDFGFKVKHIIKNKQYDFTLRREVPLRVYVLTYAVRDND